MNNLSKIMEYLEPLSKGKVTVDGKEFDRPKVWLKLSPTFFCVDNCFGCGKCCSHVNENLVLTETEYQKLLNYTDQDFIDYGLNLDNLHTLQTTMIKEVHTVNGKEVIIYKAPTKKTKLYFKPREKEVETCYYLFEKSEGLYRCGVHPVRSITCRMPHLRVFYTNHGCVSVGISQYGRNWAVGCPIEFSYPETAEQFEGIKAERIAMLSYLLEVANDMNCDTYISDLIDYAKTATFDNYHSMLNKDILPSLNAKKKLFNI